MNSFKQHPDDFDLIITDQVMPGLTGVEISQKILELRPSIPILLITGYSEKITAENAQSFGLSGFFSKPINEDLFLNHISQLVSESQVAHAHWFPRFSFTITLQNTAIYSHLCWFIRHLVSS